MCVYVRVCKHYCMYTFTEMSFSVWWRHGHTHPECVSMEGAWVMTDPDWEEDRACWAARLQLGPNMVP